MNPTLDRLVPVPQAEASATKRDPATLASDLLPLGDIACLLVAATLASTLTMRWWLPAGAHLGFANDIAPAGWFAAALAPFMLYDPRFGAAARGARGLRAIAAHVLRFALFAAAVLVLGAISDATDGVPRAGLMLWLSMGLVGTLLMRSLLAARLHWLQREGRLTEVVAVVGGGTAALRVMQTLREHRAGELELLGPFDDEACAAQAAASPAGGTIAHLLQLASIRRIDGIVLVTPPAAGDQWSSMLARLKELSVPIGLCPPHMGLAPARRGAALIGDTVAVSLLADRPIRHWGAVVKAAEDVLLGALVSVLLLPVLSLVAIAIRLDSPGPILFRQRRHGLNNDEFDIYKFRTMRWDASADRGVVHQTARGDDRITRVGRFLRTWSLDELPQLLNVLQGTMSLVGPRPHAIQMRTEDRLGCEITPEYAHRHRVKPGITGWAQVNGARGATNTTDQLHRRVVLDLHYVENWSLLLDLKILALTWRAVLQRTNAF